LSIITDLTFIYCVKRYNYSTAIYQNRPLFDISFVALICEISECRSNHKASCLFYVIFRNCVLMGFYYSTICTVIKCAPYMINVRSVVQNTVWLFYFNGYVRSFLTVFLRMLSIY